MSGPKDFHIDLAAPLLATLGVYRDRQLAAFDARIRTLRAAPKRRRPAPRAANDAPVHRDAGVETSELGGSSEGRAAAEAATRAAADARITTEFVEVCDAVEAQRDALADDAGLMAACGDRFALWENRCAQVVSLPAGEDSLREARAALSEGESLVQYALDVSQQVQRRREVVRAITESFHAIGFFTELEDIEHSNDPGKPVTVVARKGTEEVTVLLPLGDAPVQSRWAGQTDERCVDSFFNYVEQMGQRGLNCRPARSDLADRPRLRQAGRKDLPRAKSEGN